MRKYLVLLTIPIFGIVLLAGCSPSRLTEGATAFSKSAEIALASHSTALEEYTESNLAFVYQQLAESRSTLQLSIGCTEALVHLEATSPCAVVPQNPPPGYLGPVSVENIVVLATALSEYATALGLLAGDFSANEKAFGEAVGTLFKNLGELDATVAKANDGTALLTAAKRDAIAALVVEISQTYLEYRRAQKLGQLVKEMNPVIQEAARILTESMQHVKAEQAAVAYDAMLRAQEEHDTLVEKQAKPEKIVTAVTTLHEKVALYNSVLATPEPFAGIAKAHAVLAETGADGNFSRKDFQVFLQTLLSLAEKAKAVADA